MSLFDYLPTEMIDPGVVARRKKFRESVQALIFEMNQKSENNLRYAVVNGYDRAMIATGFRVVDGKVVIDSEYVHLPQSFRDEVKRVMARQNERL